VRALLLAAALFVLPLPAAAHALPAIDHVFIIVLENENATTTFADNSPAPYLAKTLPTQGEFVPNYYGTGHNSLDNYVSMFSGQPPNPQTQGDCPIYSDFIGNVGSDGIAVGNGCVYPAGVKTIADQLTAKGLTWGGYMQDMGADPTRETATCGHPAVGSPDKTQAATAKDQYATRHDPFVYFHSIIDTPACAANVVNLDRLDGDLASASTTPNYTFITPDLCNDGHDASCADGGPGGLPAADAFLQTWVPKITASPAYQRGGLLMIVFDEGSGDSTACCNEQSGPNTPAAGGQSGGPGGGRTGAVFLSPFITPGSTTTTAYNHYSLLRSVEDLFGLAHLGYAGQDGLTPFGADVFTRTPSPPPTPAPTPPPAASCKRVTVKLSQRYGHVRRAKVYVGKRRLKTVHGKALRRVSVKARRGHYTLRVVETTKRRTFTIKRKFNGCKAAR
jgi:phosphatidylinositol-3-phosphatase